MTCTSASDCRSAGFFTTADVSQTLIEHWDGVSWAIEASPNNDGSNILNGVTCTSPSDCWAIGEYYYAAGSRWQTLTEHWEGTSWSIVTSPNATRTSPNNLKSVTCTSDSNCWAVGYVDLGTANSRSLIEHWNGSVWAIVPSPDYLPPTGSIQVVVQTNPLCRAFFVDGVGYSEKQLFSWTPGSSHTIATTSMQSGGTGVQYVWTNWSGGGAISHTVTPAINTTYTATFRTQYYLTMAHGTGGTVSPASGWKNSGASVSITARPSTGYSFTNWTGNGTGSFSGTANPVPITMGGPITEMATFTHN